MSLDSDNQYMANLLKYYPVPIGLWIFDCFGFRIGIGSRGTKLGTRA